MIKPATILIVEDNPITRKMIRVALETAGYSTLEADDGRNAVELMTRYLPDLVLQDLHLPDMDGFELLDRLRGLPGGNDIPILACSGFLSKLEMARSLQLGITDYFFKPVDPSRLVQTVRAYLPPAAPQSERAGQGRRILIVDDDALQLKLLRVHLTHMGFQVVAAGDGMEALTLARKTPPQAIVSDLLLPRLDGYQLCLEVRRDPRLSQVPLVLVTAAYTEEEDRRLAQKVGASAFVVRSPDNNEVIESLMLVLGQTPPAPPTGRVELPTEEYTHRLIRQLERQVALNARATARLSLLEAELAILAGFAETLKVTARVDSILNNLIHSCIDAAGVSRGAVYLVEPGGGFTLGAQLGYQSEPHELVAGFFDHASILSEVAERGQTVEIPSAAAPVERVQCLLNNAGARSMLLTPLKVGEKVLGVLAMVSTHHQFGEGWLSFAKAVGNQVGQTVELARALARLSESEQRYRDLVESLDAVVWEADAATCATTFVSSRAEVLLGFPMEHFHNNPQLLFSLIHAEDREQTLSQLETAMEAKRDVQIEARFVTAEGRPLWLHTSVQIIRDAAGKPTRLHGVTVDISERNRLEEQVRQSQKMEAVGRLAGGVAHDFNNLLTVISGYSDLMLERLHPQDPLYDSVTQIRKAGERAAGLTRQLLAFSRKQILAPRVLDLNAVLRDMEKMLTRLIGEDIDLALVVVPNLGRVKADPGQIEQIILNLVINARDAMPLGGKLTLETANVNLSRDHVENYPGLTPGSYVRLAVSDTGCGMDKAVMSRIFEPFFTTKETGRGTGLGLSTVYGIVKQSNGHVEVYSEPGAGTTFKIYLPCVAQDAELSKSNTASGHPVRGHETVLVVEDEQSLRAMIQQILEKSGYKVLQTRSGSEAQNVCALHPGAIDLLITDVVMPEVSGRQVAEHVSRIRPEVKVLYMSGYTDEAVVRHGVLSAEMAFLQKPFTPGTLVRKVREVLDRQIGQPA
jgi:PAS domain S-box-containing protein